MRQEPSHVPALFTAYCDAVCALALSDQALIRAELTAHMEDRRDAFLRAGCSEEEAEQSAVAAMGSPEIVGRAMAKAHPLGWELLLAMSKAVLALVLAVVFLTCGVPYAVRLDSALTARREREACLVNQWSIDQTTVVDQHVSIRLDSAAILRATLYSEDGSVIFAPGQYYLELEGCILFDSREIPLSRLFFEPGNQYDNLGNRYNASNFSGITPAVDTVYIDYDNDFRAFRVEIPLDWGDEA